MGAEAAGPGADGLERALLSKPSGSSMPAAARWAWTVVLWWTVLGIGTVLAMVGPTLEELAAQLRLPVAGTGSIITGRACGYLAAALWCGDLLQRLPNAAAVFGGPLALACLGVFAIPSITSYPIFVTCFVFQGASMGFLDTGGNLMMLDLWRGSSYQNGFVHAFHFFFGLGAAVAPMIVRLLLQHGYGAMDAWPLVGLVLLPSCVGLAFLLCAPQPRACEEAKEGSEQKAGAFRIVLLTSVFLFIYVGIEVAFGSYVDLFSVRWLGASKVEAATLTSVYWAALCAGRAVAAAATPFVHHARYLAAHLALASASAAALAAATLEPSRAAPGSSGWWAGVVAPTAAFGFALAPLFPGAMLLAEELLEGPLLPRQVGAAVGAAAAGEMTFPFLVGGLFAISPMCFCWSMLAMCLSTSAVFLLNSAGVLGSKRH